MATSLPRLPPFDADTDTARQLRLKSTPSETALWQALRERGITHKFRRQHPVGPFVLDFFCPALRLAVEVDGGIHAADDQAEHDRFRQELIETYEVQFVRLSTEEVNDSLREAVAKVAAAAANRAAQVSHDLRWVAAGDLSVGASVVSGRSRREALILEITGEDADMPVCDLATDQGGSYITGICMLSAAGVAPSLPSLRSASPLSSLGEGTKG